MTQDKTTHYPTVEPNPDFAALEQDVLAQWKQARAFDASVQGRSKEDEFVFYDGPPFANGLPHYGHLLTGYVKDAIARYQTLRGKRVERRFGWDCHGLPAEMGAEKELNISGRQQIIDYGIGKFNDHCRSSVMKYSTEWERYVNRQARWVDFEGDYKTMDTNFMESVIWAFKQLYDKGLCYESHRVMPYSWAAETPLSNFETKLDNSYRDKTDKAVTVAFELRDKPEGAPEAEKYYLLAWTTTPWTLPSNLALAVSDKMNYACVQTDDKKACVIFAPASESYYENILCEMSKVGYAATKTEDHDPCQAILKGDVLIGMSYTPLFAYFDNHKTAFRVLDGSSFIEEGSGTGVVHMAPGFGEDDQRVCMDNGIDLIVPVDGQGRYTDEIFDLPPAPKPEKSPDGHYETERCLLRPFTQDDAELLISLHTNEQVMNTVNDGLQTEEEARADLAEFMRLYERDGFSQFAVFHKESGAFMGRAGLQMYNQRTDGGGEEKPVLRAALMPDFWHGGYGTELCRFSTALGFHAFGVDEVMGGAVPHNPRSHRMMERIGFEYQGDVKFKHFVGPFYRATKESFERAHIPLSLKGMNVIEQTDGMCEAEPYSDKQLEKYGLVNLRIINWLKQRGALIKSEDYVHSYPHCWRTDKPLIYRAMPSWYVAVTQFRDRAAELNEQINWIPSHVRDGQMGHMLRTAPDWSISRNRFWGTPIPVWKSNNPNSKEPIKVFGSIEELEDFFGQKVEDLHRPFIDELTAPDGEGYEYTRVEDVFDCWFESGSMPFAQVHYPFENKDWFESHFPADFITEYVGQTRGWFNTLIILSTALFDKPPFKNCICHGVVLDAETGLKYSKRLKNYKDPLEVIDKFGADALRWLMLHSPVMRGQDLMVDPEGKFIRDVVRLHIKPVWNAYNFFTLYANADGVKAEFDASSTHVMDRYILAKCVGAAQQIKMSLDAYDTPGACDAVNDFFEVLNNWYIRRSKERFWNESSAETIDQAAYNTLYTVLHVMCRAASPLLPLLTDAVYQGLTGETSVHLADFPEMELASDAQQLADDMDRVRDACNTVLSIRSAENIRIRQPLASATLYGAGSARLKEYESLIADEVNVKSVNFSDGLDAVADHKLTIHFPVAGKRLGAKMKAVGGAAKQGDWTQEGGQMIVGGEALQEGEYTLQLVAKDNVKGAQALSSNDALVVLDLEITPALEAEGLARDVVRLIQQARKDANLNVADRISLSIQANEKVSVAINAHSNYVCEQTLATQLDVVSSVDAQHISQQTLDGALLVIGVNVAEAVAA